MISTPAGKPELQRVDGKVLRATMVTRKDPMPLRNHFRPPVSKKSSWEGFHAMWPTCIVRQLRNQLPPGYTAEPRVHLGTLMEIDVAAPESGDAPRRTTIRTGNGDMATAAWTATTPAVAVGEDGTAPRVRIRSSRLRS